MHECVLVLLGEGDVRLGNWQHTPSTNRDFFHSRVMSLTQDSVSIELEMYK